MASSFELLQIAGQQEAARADMFRRSVDVFSDRGSKIRMTGSHQYGGVDMFSDLDLWVENPDTVHADTLADREELFSKIGNVLLNWERPRFAPVGGMHSILLYDTPSPLPIELNVFQVAASTLRSEYATYFDEPVYEDKQAFWNKYPWRQEPDSQTFEARSATCYV